MSLLYLSNFYLESGSHVLAHDTFNNIRIKHGVIGSNALTAREILDKLCRFKRKSLILNANCFIYPHSLSVYRVLYFALWEACIRLLNTKKA